MTTVLIVEDNTDLAYGLRNNLEIEGYEVEVAVDGTAGLARARALRPDLIILDLMLPGLDGYRVLKALRDDGDDVPVLILTAHGEEADKVRGFRLGADDYEPKPFRFEELELRVANALRRRVQVEATLRAQVAREPGPRDPRGIHGTLDQLGVSAMLMVMEMEKKSGVLVFKSPVGETARVFLKQGRVVRARLDGKPAPKNAELIYLILRWADGKFEFSALDVDMENELDASTTALLVEGARRLDEDRADKQRS